MPEATTTLEWKLLKCRVNRVKSVRNMEVMRTDVDQFYIDSKYFTLKEAVAFIVANTSAATRGIDYDKTVFFLTRGGSTSIVSQHRLRNRDDHNKLLEKARSSGYYVYYADVLLVDGKYVASAIMLIDWDSVPDSSEAQTVPELKCPYCQKVANTSSGRTLHVKSRHPEHYDDYIAGQTTVVPPTPPDESPEPQEGPEEVSHDVPDSDYEQPVIDKNAIRCPYCPKTMTSTPGRTLHVKSQHPDKYEEYLKSK